MVDELRHRHSVKDLCKFLGVSRSGYYRYLARKNKLGKDKEFEEKILYSASQQDLRIPENSSGANAFVWTSCQS